MKCSMFKASASSIRKKRASLCGARFPERGGAAGGSAPAQVKAQSWWGSAGSHGTSAGCFPRADRHVPDAGFLISRSCRETETGAV